VSKLLFYRCLQGYKDVLCGTPCCLLLQSDLNADVTEPFRRQGSFRKVLPSLPTANSQLSMSAKMIDRPAISNRGLQKAYSQYQQEYSIISE
jgi:hypothetical protein